MTVRTILFWGALYMCDWRSLRWLLEQSSSLSLNLSWRVLCFPIWGIRYVVCNMAQLRRCRISSLHSKGSSCTHRCHLQGSLCSEHVVGANLATQPLSISINCVYKGRKEGHREEGWLDLCIARSQSGQNPLGSPTFFAALRRDSFPPPLQANCCFSVI